MNARPNPPGWFDTLRRDRSLFAVIGALVLALNMLQPLAAAGMELDGRWVLCTGEAAPGSGGNFPLHDKCPVCVAGHNCAAPAPVHKAVAAAPALAAHTALVVKITFAETVADFAIRRSGRTPAIRAPPISA